MPPAISRSSATGSSSASEMRLVISMPRLPAFWYAVAMRSRSLPRASPASRPLRRLSQYAGWTNRASASSTPRSNWNARSAPLAMS